VLNLWLIIFSSGRRHPIDNEMLLVIDFVNLKIKPAQSFRGAHRSSVWIRVFIDVIYIYISILLRKFVTPI
jgi:hypothetical protein